MQDQLILVLVIALVGILGLVWTNNKRRREFLKLVNAWVAWDVIHSTLSSEKAPRESKFTSQIEREACAKLVEEWPEFSDDGNKMLKEIAEAIRNRV